MARALLSSPLSACFFPDSSSSASAPQLAAALCAVDSDIAISRSVEERKVCTQNIVKYNWGKNVTGQASSFAVYRYPSKIETPLPTARLSFMPGITSRSFISYNSFPPSYSLILARSL